MAPQFVLTVINVLIVFRINSFWFARKKPMTDAGIV